MKKCIIILLISFTSFGQGNLVTREIFGNRNTKGWNTFIGGVSSTISTSAQLATKLGISNNRIRNFVVVGSDIKCRIVGGSYSIPYNAFYLNTSITYYTDTDGLVSIINTHSFRECTNLISVNFPGCTTVSPGTGYLSFYNCINLTSVNFPEVLYCGTQSFQSCTSLDSISLPKCTTIGVQCFAYMSNVSLINIPKCVNLGDTSGSSPGNDNVFLSIKTSCVINANIFLQTNNSGAADGDLQYAISSRAATVNYFP